MRVAIVGGTGAFGRALAERLHANGVDVVIGSRDPQRAQEMASVLGVEGDANEDVVVDADLVVLSVRSNAALETAQELSERIGETPLLCVASDLRFTSDGVLPGRHGYSLAEHVARVVDGPVVSGLHSLAAASLTGSEAPEQDALVCGDDEDAKRMVLELVDPLVAGQAIDAGPLANSRALEGMTAVILNVNRRYHAHAGLRVTGL